MKPQGQGRGAERTHLYLAALLQWDATESVVRIRNLSAHGALIEGARLPPVGEPVQLTRGRLCARGRTVWSHAGRSGLKLDDPLHLAEWMAAPVNPDQQRVDGLVAALRGGQPPAVWPSPAASPDESGDAIRLARQLLDAAANALANDAAVVAARGHELQQLELCLELLGTVTDGASGGVRLSDLRVAARAALAR